MHVLEKNELLLLGRGGIEEGKGGELTAEAHEGPAVD